MLLALWERLKTLVVFTVGGATAVVSTIGAVYTCKIRQGVEGDRWRHQAGKHHGQISTPNAQIEAHGREIPLRQ